MMKRSSALLIILAFCLSASTSLLAAKKKKKTSPLAPAPAASFPGLEDSVIMVTFDTKQFDCFMTKNGFKFGDDGGRGASGSGFIVQIGNDQYLYTNVHCLAEATEVRFRSMSGNDVTDFDKIEVSDDQAIMDVARLKLRRPIANPLKFAPADFKLRHGDKVVAYGDSGGIKSITLLPGKILAVGPEAIESDATFIKGNSGGPLLLVDSHSVVGINTLVLPPAAGQPKHMVQGTRFEGARRVSFRPDRVPRWRAMNFNGLVDERRRIDQFNRGTAALMVAASECLTPGPFGFKLADGKQELVRAGAYKDLLSKIGDSHDPIVKRVSEGVDEINSKLSAGVAVAGGAKVGPTFGLSYGQAGKSRAGGAPVASHVAKQYFQSFYQSVLRGAENTAAGFNETEFCAFHAETLRDAKKLREAVLGELKKLMEGVKSADWGN